MRSFGCEPPGVDGRVRTPGIDSLRSTTAQLASFSLSAPDTRRGWQLGKKESAGPRWAR